MRYATLNEEKKLWKRGYGVVACLDEVGRGPLAGPVIACAVAVIKNWKLKIKNLPLRDSKKLSPRQRNKFYDILTANPCILWGIGKVYPATIDRINIYKATKLAMKRALAKLKRKADFLILDGNMKLDVSIPQKAMVKADEKVFSCAAASIIAKVKRDRAMKRYHRKYPEYGFDKHKGYGTPQHLAMLKRYGSCPIHRKTFVPLQKILNTIY